MPSVKKRISGWGCYPAAECALYRPERYSALTPCAPTCVARGRGRSYGDASLNDRGGVVLTERVNRLLELDTTSGTLRAEGGAGLDEILEVIVPRGWFLPVVPGTRHVTVGGCIAADIHGKNQHLAGTFGHYVREMELVLANGERMRCTPDENADVFYATVGGMGLTGIIGEALLQLKPIDTAWMIAEYHTAGSLDELMDLFEDSRLDDEYTVAWLDCLAGGKAQGRGVYSRAHHASAGEVDGAEPFRVPDHRVRHVPFTAPSWLLNRHTMAAYNRRYFRRHQRLRGQQRVDYVRHFFPLDQIGAWNRLYGRRGFVQYQCVVPTEEARPALHEILDCLQARGVSSFLGVLKRFGGGGNGLLSFPFPGYTLALDIPAARRGALEVLEELDELVLARGGRVYLAKDARLNAANFRAMYPSYPEWLAVKKRVDPDNVLESNLARRLRIGEAP